VDTEESLPSEPENSTRLAMGEGERGWLPEPERRPARVARGTGAVAAGEVSLSLTLSLSLSPARSLSLSLVSYS
jgi:hypothetical protein